MVRPTLPPYSDDGLYEDCSIFITKMDKIPSTTSKVVGERSQIFQIAVQTYGRDVTQRMGYEVKINGRRDYSLPHLFGYSVSKMPPHSPIVVDIGEVIEITTSLRPRNRWWQRLVDTVWDWFSPPRAKFYLTGVSKKASVEA